MFHGAWMVSALSLQLIACPVELVAPQEARFACSSDDDCAPGFGCIDSYCLDLSSDAGTADAAASADASSSSDAAVSDISASDSYASDISASDIPASDISASDATIPDSALPDAAAPDSSVPDAGCPSDWWSCRWSRRRALSFNNAAIGEQLASFPLLLVLNSGRIDYSNTQDNGEDLRFIDANGVNTLDHEIERWDEGGDSLVWVKVPQIDATDTDFIWMYYGNAAASAATPQQASQVWSAGYQAVYHFNQGLRDSSASGFHGDDSGHATADGDGWIGRGREFSGDQSYVNLGSDLPLARRVGACTLSTWVREDANDYEQHLISISANNGTTPTTASRATLIFKMGEFRGGGRSDDAESFIGGDTVGAGLLAQQWYYLVAVIDFAGDQVRFYKNDDYAFTLPVNFSQSQTSDTTSTSNALGSEDEGGSAYFDGRLDEVRVAAVARSAAWIAAEYRSQADLGYVNYGAEENW